LYATLDKTSQTLNSSGNTDDIKKMLYLISYCKLSISTAPQIDNSMRHECISTFTYKYLLKDYSDISYNPVPPNGRITIGKSNPTYVHSIFSEEIVKETGKTNQIRDNLASYSIDLSYADKQKIGINVPHYVGDETTIPSDLQTIFKYVFWFHQKFRTCDLPFLPNVLTMMKMTIADKIVFFPEI
jgi:hypothetical protein